MKKLLVILFIPFILFAQKGDEFTLTKVGEKAPAFEVKMLDGKTITSESLKGKVVLINFFATWCPPCQAELPHLEKEIYDVYKENKDFVLLVIGREHKAEEVEKFKVKKELDLPFGIDPERKIYSKFAKQNIPRNFLIDKEGKIVSQYVGFNKEEFEELKSTIKKLLK